MTIKGINISIKDLIDKDIKENMAQYKGVNGKPDPNIDFRRVLNQAGFIIQFMAITDGNIRALSRGIKKAVVESLNSTFFKPHNI